MSVSLLYDIWSDMGIGIPYKVYLGSTKKPPSLIEGLRICIGVND